jgi:hypothetical protein
MSRQFKDEDLWLQQFGFYGVARGCLELKGARRKLCNGFLIQMAAST